MKFKILTLLFAFLAVACEVNAQATLSVQGTIQRSFGGAVDDGKYSLTFKLYTQESGGTPVWSETQDDIEVIGGVYSALLGEANPLTAGFNEVYYLGIAVDGGAELIPRTRLTSAPYALSLIGQSNTFPSAGAVGIGTVTPQTKLHVHDDDNVEMRITTLADKGASMRLNAGDHTGFLSVNQYSFGIGSENLAMNIVASRVHLYGDGGLRAYTDGSGLIVNGRMHITNGNIYSDAYMQLFTGGERYMFLGDGYARFDKYLYVPGAVSQYFGGPLNVVWPWNSATGVPFVNQNHGISIRGDQNIAAPNFIAYSDRRIKKDFHASSGKGDLATLMQLEVTDYRHIDTLAKGSAEVKGFIAQQVEQIFPQAVTTGVNVIPDIFSKPAAIQVNGTEATLNMPVAHQLESGNRVRIMQDGGGQMEYDVVRVEGNAFTVKDWNAAFTQPEKVFVYGKEVNDFRTVDYDKIHNLNVSATQELARRVAQLEAANAGLQLKNNELQQLNEGLRGDVNGLNDRLTKLEKLLTADSKR